MAVTYSQIATQTLGSSASSVTFSSISGTYTDLVLVQSVKTDSTGNPNIFIQVGNGSIDTGSNYSWTRLYGTGTTAGSSRGSNVTDGVIIGDANPTDFTADLIHFMNYSNTTTYKTIIARGNMASLSTHADVGLWRSTSAINQIKVYAAGRNLVSGSTFSLYGILAA